MNLVTGATGLLGTRVIYDLLERGELVRAGRRKNSDMSVVQSVFKFYGDKDLVLYSKIKWIDLDLLDLISIQEALIDIRKVYHCAAVVSFHYSDYELMYQTNVIGTHNLVNAAIEERVDVFCHVSSTAAIGKSNQDFQTESNEWKNSNENSYYAVTKHAAECEVWRGKEEGLKVVVVNPSIIVGPGDWNRSSVGIFKTIYNGLKYYTNGGNAYVDVRDVSEIMLSLVEKQIYGERFLCVGENISFKSLFDLIADTFGVREPYILAKQWQANLVWRIEEFKYKIFRKKPVITKETARSANTVTKFTNQKIVNEIGYEFTPIKESVQYTCDYLSNFTSIRT